ncbi:glycerol-3-phosphate cytidylyltransferase [Jannaschia sp. EhC01]|uniref:Adenylyltransferase/cytidyltransferase family protein n=1 Tax=Gymnodinialimonas phycosphaerae TaxID=2841589 RepID=A0A975TU05_9RHOB|nr:adenylyltransferase/cytidyltransferase family protein [Gymnodinialimonas phycosphaerae]MBY4894885.1 adenylyltransferase/cytidyltransferase family protein [Gymnodinialimonas phycosphaerae]OAN85062.1 glycerol-3-phosphate cytidylyltransferase [Jannaschia sp. EhC01]
MGKRIITYGTFDLFHIGHVRLLKRLAALGDHLTVCVSSDEFNAIKGKKTVIPYAQRAEIVGACRYVDNVLPEHDWDQKRDDIVREKIDIFAMGDDWSGKFNDLGDLCEVFYLPRTEDVSSTSLKAFMEALRDEQLKEVKHLIETLNSKAAGL